MTVLVDGYNLYFTGLNAGGRGKDMQRVRQRVVEALDTYRGNRSIRIVIFFDGGAAGSHMPRTQHERAMEIRFSDPGRKADADIMQAVSRAPEPAEVRVVTSDLEIKRFVERLGAMVISSEDFAEELMRVFRKEAAATRGEPPEKYDRPVGKDEVDYWLRIFGQDM